MTSTSATNPQRPQPLLLGARRFYLLLAGLFAAGIVVQVFFAGLGVLVDPGYFSWHTTFAHLLEPLLLAMLVTGAIGRIGWRVSGLTVLTLVLFLLQYVFIHAFQGAPRALHVVNALALFWLALYVARCSWQLIRAAHPTAGASTEQPLRGGF